MANGCINRINQITRKEILCLGFEWDKGWKAQMISLSYVQCDKIAILCFQFWLFTTMKLCPILPK